MFAGNGDDCIHVYVLCTYIDNVIILYLKAYLVLCVCVKSFKELYTRGKWEVGWIPGNSGLVCECW